ncbi:Degenerin deg-1 [Holothuria leucospilota]|uniref:Degenerin deg-1 n=1 Tax=Holothuria leucospilota TaxID=206669 RepID=A0A9Q1BDL8_HOLLE|nr:Degenerin deg-1 [Holothuria leucospilota]
MSLNISFDDEKEEDSFQRTTDVKTVATILNNFADATTAHGIPQIITRRRIAAKLFWICVVSISLCIFCYQTAQLIQNYYKFHTNIELVSSEYVEFPAVTICNFNRVKLTKVVRCTLPKCTIIALPQV